jgi:hypothetical protein
VPSSIIRKVCAATLVLGAAGTAFTLLSGTSANADPSAAVWDRLRTCESSGNYQSVDSNAAHFGAYQFDQSTWDSVGGKGRPDQNSAVEQDYRALYLYRMRGWQPWQCADSSHLNLQNDAGARTGRAPSYAEPARPRTAGTPAPTPVEPARRLSTPKAATPAPALPAVPPPPAPGPPARQGAPVPPPVPAAPAREAAFVPPVPPVPASPLADLIPPAGSGTLLEPALPAVTLTYGTCTPVLANWQNQMNRYGYGLGGDGCYDDATSSAAHQLQYANGIHKTDTIGPYTLVAAYIGRSPR